MKPIPVSVMRPQFGTFRLEATGDTLHRLRKISVDDYEWVEETFGLSLEQIFTEGKVVKLSTLTKLIFHQLEDKSPFLAEDREIIDDEGEKKSVRISGAQRFREAIINPDEAKLMTAAFLKTLGLSQPARDASDGEKKKARGPHAGARSSTS